MAASSADSDVCSTLSSQLPGQVAYSQEAAYRAAISSYFYQQARLSPRCVVFPRSTSDVANIIKTIAASRGKAAIRGAGHTPSARAANIDNAVTIDLSNMNTVTLKTAKALDLPSSLHTSNLSYDLVSSEKYQQQGFPELLSTDGGASWGDVYQTLSPLNLISVGGRGTSLGVGSLITGGGISFFLGTRGFACDNVANMEVVLTDGSVVSTNKVKRPDLFKALKGGSNNFGVVTRFDLMTYPQGQLYGGFLTYPASTIPRQLTAFAQFMEASKSDPHAEIICAIGYVGAYQSVVVSLRLHYTKAVENPAIFEPCKQIRPQLKNTMRLTSNFDLVNEAETNQAKNARGIYVNTVFRPTAAIIEEVYRLWSTTIDSIKSTSGLAYFLIFQRMPAIKHGNALGLEGSTDPMVLCLLSVTWTQAQEDVAVNRVTQELIDNIDQATKAAGLYERFKYLNYASPYQDPITSYGPASNAQLQAVSRKYDPKGFFQSGIPGPFKLSAASP